jgi:putative hemin transport protein
LDATTSNFRVINVARWTDVTPHMRRITFSGQSLTHFDNGGLHARLMFPVDGAHVWPRTTADGRMRWAPGEKKMPSRAYTVRHLRTDLGELDIDFVLHGDEGVASRWAAHIKEGDAIGIFGPIGRIIPKADWYLLVGDETALSPIGRILEYLHDDARGVALLEVADPGEEQSLQAPKGVTIRWLHRNGAHAGRSSLLTDAALSQPIPAGDKVFCWIGAERSTFQQVRDHWRDRCKIGMSQSLAVPYWRFGSEQFKDEDVDPARIEYLDLADPDKVLTDWKQYRARASEATSSEFAKFVGLPEASVIAASVGSTAVRLDDDWEDIINSLPDIGRVGVVTKCEGALHEKSGVFGRIMWDDERPVVLDNDINLRIRLESWACGFAIRENTARSIKVFDHFGAEVLRITLDASADIGAFDDLVRSHANADQTRTMKIRKPVPVAAERADSIIDARGLLSDWRSMLDTHDVFALARRYGASRVQAYRLVPDELARKVDTSAFRRLLTAVADAREEVMIFVASPGNVQIHIGTVDGIETKDRVLAATGPSFRLELLESRIASCWLINKPTTDGDISSLEIFDAEGAQLAWVFSKRKPGTPQLASWRPLLEAAVRQ